MRWQPTSVRMALPTKIPSSTSPCHVITDVGNAYLKLPNNPQGTPTVISEFIGTQLAEWFGLPTFEYALMTVSEAELYPDRADLTSPITVFATREEDGEKWQGSADELKLIVNAKDISRLVVFDTWVGNYDRHSKHMRAGEEAEHRNDGNVFLSTDAERGKLKLKVYDHTHCHFAILVASPDVDLHQKITDDAVYGLFPEFRPFINRPSVQSAIHQLGQMNQEIARQVVQAVPGEWLDRQEIRDKLAEFIKSRSEFLCQYIESRLCD